MRDTSRHSLINCFIAAHSLGLFAVDQINIGVEASAFHSTASGGAQQSFRYAIYAIGSSTDEASFSLRSYRRQRHRCLFPFSSSPIFRRPAVFRHAAED